jgi:hypothetical protein
MSGLTLIQNSGATSELKRSLKHSGLKPVAPALAELKAETMLRVTRTVVLRRGDLSEEDFQALREAGHTDAQIIEIVTNIALYRFFNRFDSVAKRKVNSGVLQPGANAPRVGIAQSTTRPAERRARPPKPHISKKVLL